MRSLAPFVKIRLEIPSSIRPGTDGGIGVERGKEEKRWDGMLVQLSKKRRCLHGSIRDVDLTRGTTVRGPIVENRKSRIECTYTDGVSLKELRGLNQSLGR